MKEVVTIHVGQCGTELGAQCWDLFCLEHKIEKDGKISNSLDQINDHSQFFSEDSMGKVTPRSIMIDLEPTIINNITAGPLKYLFNSEQLISGKEDAAGIYAKGYHTIGKEMIDICLERIRKIADNCSNLQGFIITTSIGGGTGSGFASLLLENLSTEYPTKSTAIFPIYSSSYNQTAFMEPYNEVFAIKKITEYCKVNFLIENSALINICQNNFFIEMPKYNDLNRVAAQTISSITGSLRFKGNLNADLFEFESNLVPYPHINSIITSYSPFFSFKTQKVQKLRTYDIGGMLLEPFSNLAKCDIRHSTAMVSNIMLSGDVSMQDLNTIFKVHFKNTINYVDWSPAGPKFGIVQRSLAFKESDIFQKVNKIGCCLHNTTSIRYINKKITNKFKKLFSKKIICALVCRRGNGRGRIQ